METRITATELARNVSSILNRIRYRGERFVVERNGETIAVLAPPQESSRKPIRDLIEALNAMGWPDEDFAKDLEEIQARQGPAQYREWPS